MIYASYGPFILTLQIARRLLGKILIDLRNTREEAINVAELKRQCQDLTSIAVDKGYADRQQKNVTNNDESRRTCHTSEKPMDPEDDEDKEIKYRLDPKLVMLIIIIWFIPKHK